MPGVHEVFFHALLGGRKASELIVQTRVDLIWEGWVIEQVLTFLNLHRREEEADFLDTRDEQ